MTITLLVPAIATILFILFSLSVLTPPVTAWNRSLKQKSWYFPAALSVLFLLFSIKTIESEGLLGFWANHTHNLWGNQVWLDLLLAISIAWFLVVPQIKALGMRPLPWFVTILCSGCVGFLALIARMLYLRENVTPKDAARSFQISPNEG